MRVMAPVTWMNDSDGTSASCFTMVGSTARLAGMAKVCPKPKSTAK